MFTEKKAKVLVNLIISTYKKEIYELKLYGNKEFIDLKITLSNELRDVRFFIGEKDTWNTIKVRLNKIVTSDFVCIVCFEKKQHHSFCSTCAEPLCLDCHTTIHIDNAKCVVCKQSMYPQAFIDSL